MSNVDNKVVDDFGDEWELFDHSGISRANLLDSFNQYFRDFPFDELTDGSVGFDMGCGTGRWAGFVANRVGTLNCIDPSEKAVQVARKYLAEFPNINFHVGSVDSEHLENESQDFGYCLGVLHHVPDTLSAIGSCAKLLKKDAPFLLYLYYNFDNKPTWFRVIWKVTDLIRRLICVLPRTFKIPITSVIAVFIYLPLARLSFALEIMGMDVSNVPLSDYRRKRFYIMRTDALDRFGTRLEKRFSKSDIEMMLLGSGFSDVKFSDMPPYWTCVARKE